LLQLLFLFVAASLPLCCSFFGRQGQRHADASQITCLFIF
jgi:hypothetical protein